MAFSGNFMCTSFKKELLYGAHDFDATSGDTFKIALFTNAATLNAATTAYATANEASGTNYTAGGEALNPVDPTASGTTALLDFGNATWVNSTVTARGALIYNTTPNTTSIALTNPSVVVLDFGGDKTSTAGNFTVVFPTPDASNAIIRIA
tara:strand:- start:462 stop:914 length:453 start_codon:yes stop_codon:yes gene_type:complete